MMTKTKITDQDIAFMNQGYDRLDVKWRIIKNAETHTRHFARNHSNYGMTLCGRDLDNPKFQTEVWHANFAETLYTSRDNWNACKTCVNQFRIQTELKDMRAW